MQRNVKVYVCSPYRGRTGKRSEVENNIEAAKRYCGELVKRCPEMIPIAPHIYFTQFLDDNDPKQRELGLAMARRILAGCKAVMVFGDFVSAGMREELMTALQIGIPVFNGYAALVGKGLVSMNDSFWEKEVGLPVLHGNERRRAVVLPCNVGDTLWAVYEDDDTGDVVVGKTPPVRAVAVLAGGKFAADVYGDGVMIDIGGPDLYITEEEARAEQKRRRAEIEKARGE